MKIKHTLAVLSAALWPLAGAFAAEAPADAWQFGVTVPLWAPQINGDVTVHGVQQNVDISFSELEDHLDASFSLALEARKGKFGIYGDVGYMKFSADGSSAAGGHADFELKFLVADAGASYRIVQTESEHPFLCEVIAGLRYWSLKTDLKVTDALGAVRVNNDDSTDLVDPIIGLRGSQYLTRKVHLDFQGDIGGFGLSDDQADLDWSVMGLLSYDFARWFTLSAGYKALAVDVSRGSGTGEHGVDIVFHGLAIAVNFRF